MANKAKVSCPTCGDSTILAKEVRLHTFIGAPQRNFYAFECPICGARVERDASADVVTLIRGVGSPETITRIPAEALEEHTGPAITANDVLDFMLALDARDAVTS